MVASSTSNHDAANGAENVSRRISFAKINEPLKVPNLLAIQTDSFDRLVGNERWAERLEKAQAAGDTSVPAQSGLAEIFEEISPIRDFQETMQLSFSEPEFADPKYSVEECKDRDATYSAPLYIKAEFMNLATGEVKQQTLFMGDFPLMTEAGTFVINGTERVVVSQLVRSPGAYFEKAPDRTSDKDIYSARVIPSRGAWFELEIDKRDQVGVRLDRKRKQSVTVLLKALGWTESKILAEFGQYDSIRATLEKDSVKDRDEALLDIYRKLRPGEPPTVEAAQALLDNMYFTPRRYDLAKVGRYKLNRKLGVDVPMDSPEASVLSQDDIAQMIRYLCALHAGETSIPGVRDGEEISLKIDIDDIDHFGNRRIRTVGELIENQIRTGLSRMERVVRERMTTQDVDAITPQSLVNIRPVVAAIKEFFGTSQLSQFMDQNNSLSGLTNKRRLSALGPGGLSRERAGIEVRDVHPSHYGRMCPIETPEGPNIGLIGSLSCYARVNSFGFIETPYRKIVDGHITDEVHYLTADEEDRYVVAQANTPHDKDGKITEERIVVRTKGGNIEVVGPEAIEYMDVSPRQMVSVATAMIPFLEHDDANRALMGANMQRQAVPLLNPKAPFIGTGMEYVTAHDSGVALLCKREGIVEFVDANQVRVRTADGSLDQYNITKFHGSNAGMCYNQRPIVSKGDKVEVGEILADGPSMEQGELALGQNVLVAFMTWEGYNYEDAVIMSERLVKDDVYTSIHIDDYDSEARDTKLGPEEITREIPNVGEDALKNLDENGIIRIGAEVKDGDILVGKVTPKGLTEQSPEERLLHAIFGEKAREVRDTSLRVPHGGGGIVRDVRVFTRAAGDELAPGVNKLVRVYIVQKRKINEGDKMAGRHGNKGVVSRIMPEEDMPFLPDGTPVDIMLNPLGVPSRMNIGQVLELHLGMAARELGIYIATPVFDGAQDEDVWGTVAEAGMARDAKTILYDGRTGEPFDNRVSVGVMYMIKLAHMVDDKLHARSIGPYSLVTQQPLGGKAQFGGQRFGEMEVWALEAYGAAYTLQEILTYKSDDVVGRVKTYESIVKGQQISRPGVPESFRVLVKELQALGLDMKVLDAQDEEIKLEDMDEDEGIRFSDVERTNDRRAQLDEYSDRAAELSAAEEAADAAEEDAADVEDVEDNFDTDEE